MYFNFVIKDFRHFLKKKNKNIIRFMKSNENNMKLKKKNI